LFVFWKDVPEAATQLLLRFPFSGYVARHGLERASLNRVQVVDPVKITSSPNLPDACLNQPYTFTPTKTGGLAPFSWAFSASRSESILIVRPEYSAALPLVTGTYSVLFGVDDASETGDSQTITLTINQCP
jgi:hypothetical protein